MTKTIKNLATLIALTLLLALSVTPVAFAANGDAPPSVENPFGSDDEDANEDPAPANTDDEDDADDTESEDEEDEDTENVTAEDETVSPTQTPPALTLGGTSSQSSQSSSNNVIAANTAESLPNTLPTTGPAALGLLALGSIVGGIKIARKK